MKRDFELVRLILLEFEARDAKGQNPIAPEGYSNEEIRYHVEILVEAGFVGADDISRLGITRPTQLTWQGHEFLDSIRDSSQWGKIKTILTEKSLSLTFDSIKTAAAVLVKGALGG